MKDIPQDIQDRMDSNNLEPFLLLRIGPNAADTVELLYTTLPYDYTWANPPGDDKTYISEGRLISIDPPRVSNSLDKETFKVGLSDSDRTLRATIDSWKMHGAPFVLLAGAVNNTPNTINGTPAGRPFPDMLTSYKGTVDTWSYVITPDEQIVLSVEGTSPVAALDLKRTLLTSKIHLEQRYPADTSYDQVMEGSNEIILLWGK